MQSEYLEADLPGNRLTIRECEVLKLMSGENTSASRVDLALLHPFRARRAVRVRPRPDPALYLGPLPVITISFEISWVGSATIFVAEIFMPFLSSLTVAGLPSAVNVNPSGTVYSRC